MQKNSTLNSTAIIKSLLLSVVIFATTLINLNPKQLFAYLSDIQLNQETSSAVEGQVWLDENNDGLFDATNESGVPNVLIKLHSSTSAPKKLLSDAQGKFEFSGLDVGDYSLEFINPLDYQFVGQSTDSDVNPETGEISNLSITEDGSGKSQVKAGLIKQEIQTPTPIALEMFELSLGIHNGQNGVHLKWKTTSEIETKGFYLLRSTTGRYGDALKISNFILSEGGANQEQEYEHWDTNVQRTVIYTYWLQEEEESGDTAEYGPRHVNAVWSGNPSDGDSTPPDGEDVDGQDQEGSGESRIYLPFVAK